MKNVFDGLIVRPDIAEERISELRYLSIKYSKTEKQIGQGKKKKQNRVYKDCGTTTKNVTGIMGIPEEDRREKGAKKY